MAVKKTYRINLRNYGSPPAVMVSQYDEGYAIAFEIFDGPLPVLASSLSGYTFKLKGRQPGNPPFLAYEFEGTLATALNAVVSFEIDTTMTGRAGKGTAELVILDEENDVKFASVNFAVYTEPAAVPDGSIDADVQRAMEIAEEVQEIVDTAAAEVKGEAEAWAVGQRDGEDVPSTDPTYENNAKYYAEQAQDIADSIGIDATLSISGKAADAKKTGDEISSLKEDLSGNIYTNPNANHVDTSKYINAVCDPNTGVEVATDLYRLTDFIQVSEDDEIYFSYVASNGTIASNGALICNRLYKFDANKNYIGFEDGIANPYTVPSNVAYIRFIISASNPYNTAMLFINPTVFPPTKYVPYSTGKTVDIAKESNLNGVDARLTNVETKIDGSLSTAYSGTYPIAHDNAGFISAIGHIVSDNTHFYTNSQLLRKGDIISVSSSDSSGKNISRISEWTSDSKYVRTLAYGSTTLNTVSVILDHDSYIRFCGMSARDFDVTVNGIVIPNVLERSIKAEASQMTDPVFWAYNIWKVLCIGDSLTSGATYAEEWGELAPVGSSIDQNYPRILGRMLNAEVTNAGFSGYSASNWYTDKLSDYTFTNYDTFIIWFGTNNGMTADSLDTEGSEANYYCKIIDAINTANNSCLIVLCKVFASGGSVIYTNQAIEAIADRYNLPIINNDDLSYELHPELHANVNNPHFGKSGNVFLAHRVTEEVGKYIAENPLRGEFGYTPRTN